MPMSTPFLPIPSFFPLVEIILAVSTGLLVWWGARQVLHLPGQQAAEISGKIVSFFLCLNLLFRPLRVIADKFNVLQMGMVASERVFRVLDNNDFIKGEGLYAPGKIKGKIPNSVTSVLLIRATRWC